ncbi:short-chain dehydrogenase [Jannaschia pagri]|uniref:Short-chain dehydrogenase n=1 Tax=Jannaschia pagri TaxID=2829797 RepID=A0ABQ4NJI3_9RHOB|nr:MULTISPECIES: SDR family oxidoreductase [unclassified Jannaschia]GIT89635.1 short-chain dehydrogenase [Jannaschia sp. AI_61]GIT94257.1 short-chain dehydrogenase [Jannaschia sp. AI_62]
MADPTHPDLTGTTAIVTGASRGIGEATARHLAALGAQVVLAARSDQDIARIAAEIEDAGGHTQAIPTDVANSQAVADLVQAALAWTGRLDLFVNNAGLIDPIARIMDSDPMAWSDVIDVNVKGVYHGLRHAMPVMAAQEGGGTIVNISSGAANSTLEGWSHYCASKAAVLRLTGVAHTEAKDKGIRVVGLSPGTVATQMQHSIWSSGVNPVSQIPWEDHISPAWVAKAIAFLTTPQADPWLGQDFSLKTAAGRQAVGMPT